MRICKHVYFECPLSPDFPSKVTDRQRYLLEEVMIEQARRGNLDTAVETLKKELPELTEQIDSFTKNDILQETIENAKNQQEIAKKIADYKKAHPILSKFYIPKF